MKLLGIEVDKMITGGCHIDYCSDDEMDWIVITPTELDDVGGNEKYADRPEFAEIYNRLYCDDKIFLWEGTRVGIALPMGTVRGLGGRIHDIDADNNSFWIGDEQFQGSGTEVLAAIAIIGNDNRPRKRDGENLQWKLRHR